MKFATKMRLEAAQKTKQYKELLRIIKKTNENGKRVCRIGSKFTEIHHLPEILGAEGFEVEVDWNEENIHGHVTKFIEQITIRW